MEKYGREGGHLEESVVIWKSMAERVVISKNLQKYGREGGHLQNQQRGWSFAKIWQRGYSFGREGSHLKKYGRGGGHLENMAKRMVI